MKAYKIDLSMYEGKVREIVSEAVQKKAFELGYEWINNGNKIFPDRKYFTLFQDGGMAQELSAGESITVDNFFSLTSAKDEPIFKPFDKVLVRSGTSEFWHISFFDSMNDNAKFGYKYICVEGHLYRYCIPYEGNEHLLSTTDNE